MSHHLVILKKAYLDSILSGHKRAECRLSRTRRLPFGRVRKNDTLWLKQSGGPVRAIAQVSGVRFFHPLSTKTLKELQARYSQILQADPTFFAERADAQYATLIRLTQVTHIEPFRVNKSDGRAWIVLPGPLKGRPRR